MLHHSIGDLDRSRACLDQAEPVAHALNDVPTLRRLTMLRATLDGAHRRARPQLTSREHDILRLLARGANRQQIAEHLGFSVSTIRNDMASLYHKLGASSRAEAVLRAQTFDLVTPPE
jgi:DNA-binding NarL/FixJ family response regulator